MSAKESVFVDSNILIYAQDEDAGERHFKARELITDCWHEKIKAAVSIKVLQEFHVNLVKRGVPVEESKKRATRYLQWMVVENSRSLLRKAFEMQMRWKFSFWDSGIVAAALRSGARELWSEDLQDGQRIESLVIRNPLKGTRN